MFDHTREPAHAPGVRLRSRSKLALASFAVLVSTMALALAGCPRSTPSLQDSGADADPFADSDGDGLCDPQELARGTRVDDTDTDADGYSDLAEVSLGFDPLLPASPDRADVVILQEVPGATAHVTAIVAVSGSGETYTGAFMPGRQAYDDGQSAAMYFESAAAIGAEPMENVVAIEGESFLAVNGRTQLVFDVRFRFDAGVQSCLRAYPFQYAVKRDDGRIVGIRRFTLLIQPPAGGPGDGTWCAPVPCL